MDYPSAEGLSIAVLGESYSGHVGRAVHGGGRNLWGRRVCPIPGECFWELCFHVAGLQKVPCAHPSLPPTLFLRRTSSPYGTRQPATRPRQPGYATRYEECSTYLPTPSWNTKPTPTASSTCAGQGGAAGCMCARAARSTAQALAEALVCVRAVPANWSANSSACCQHALKAKFLCGCRGCLVLWAKPFSFLNVWSRVVLTIRPACHLGDGQPRMGLWLDVFKDKIAVGAVE